MIHSCVFFSPSIFFITRKHAIIFKKKIMIIIIIKTDKASKLRCSMSTALFKNQILKITFFKERIYELSEKCSHSPFIL